MTDKLKQIIIEEMAKLSKETQEAINSLGWGNITEEIGKKYLLSESEINGLQLETMLILIGLENPDLFTDNIKNIIDTNKDRANKITDEIVQKILTPIMDNATENIKKNGRDKNPNPEQTLDFILSGGDYSAFAEKREIPASTDTQKPSVPVKPGQINDIKSKFTI